MHPKSFIKISHSLVTNKIIAYKDTNKKYLFTNVIKLKKAPFKVLYVIRQFLLFRHLNCSFVHLMPHYFDFSLFLFQ